MQVNIPFSYDPKVDDGKQMFDLLKVCKKECLKIRGEMSRSEAIRASVIIAADRFNEERTKAS